MAKMACRKWYMVALGFYGEIMKKVDPPYSQIGYVFSQNGYVKSAGYPGICRIYKIYLKYFAS